MMAARSGGIALVAALLVLAAVAVLLAARATVQAQHVATVDAQRRELAASADADTALSWAWARLVADGAPSGSEEIRWPLPPPLDGTAAVERSGDALRLEVRVTTRGTTVARELLVRVP